MGGVHWTNEAIDKFLINRKIKRVENYTHSQKKIKWMCIIDGYIWSCTPTHILNDNVGCPKCAGNARLTNEDVDKKLVGRNIKRIGNYIGNDVNIEWQCIKCDSIWEQNPDHVLNTGSGCPHCQFKMQSLVGEILKSSYNTTESRKLFRFNNRKYYVDFFIPSKNIIVEYNGEQHYNPIKFFGGEKSFIKQQKRDNELRAYCKKNSIRLLEIPYWLSNKEIEDTVKDFINR